MTKKINLILTFIACITLFALPLKAQSAADTGLENTLKEAETSETKEVTSDKKESIYVATETEAQKALAITPSNTTQTATSNAIKKQAKVEKFLDSKFGQWIVKRATISAHKKQIRQDLKTFEGDKAAKKVYKENAKKEVLKAKAMNSNVRTGIILIAVGIILTILPVDILRIVGSILIVVGLVFLILGLI